MIRGGNDLPTFYYIIGSFGGCRTILKCVGWRRSQQYPDQAAPIARWCLALFCQVPLALSASSHFTGQTSHLTGTTATAASSHMLRAFCKPSSASKVMRSTISVSRHSRTSGGRDRSDADVPCDDLRSRMRQPRMALRACSMRVWMHEER